MPRVRRTAAALAAVLTAGACTAVGGDPGPMQRRDGSPALLGTVDLDAAVDGDARLVDLAATAGDPVALLTDGGTRSWFVEVSPGEDGPVATTLLEVPVVGEDAELTVLPDGAFLVAGTTPDAGYQLLTVPPGGGAATITDLGLRPERSATALSPDERMLYAALALGDVQPTQLLAVDLPARVVHTTAPAVPDGTVTALVARPDGGVAALVEVDGRAVLAGFDADLRPVGEPVDLAPDAPASSPADLDVTDDGTAVATVYLGEGRGSGRLVTVVDGAVTGSVELDGVGDSSLDVVVAPDGGTARVPQADLSYPAELATVDLAGGERVAAVPLCEGAGVIGDVAPVGEDGGLVVTGSCVDGDGPQITAFLVG